MKAGWNDFRAWCGRRVAPTAPWRAAVRFWDDQMTDRAGTLAYYAMLALFPGLLIVLTILGLLGGDDLVAEVTSIAEGRGAGEGTAAVIETIARRAIRTSNATLSLTLVFSFLIAANAASGVFHAAGRAVNVANDLDDARGFVHRRLVVYGLTGLIVLLLLISLILLVVGGGLLSDIFDLVGLGREAADVYGIARWPVAIVLATGAVATVLHFAPDPSARRRRFITAGAITTVAGWVIASLGFSLYVTAFPRYGLVYGTFSTAIVLLLWLYLLAMAFLYGAELDAELRRRRVAREDAQAAPPEI